MKSFLSVVSLAILALSSAVQQDGGESCSIGDARLLLNFTSTFDTIRLGYPEDGMTIFAPSTIHWHVYSLPLDEAQDARIFMSPPGLVAPKVTDDDGTLQLFVNDLRDRYNLDDDDDDIQAGVAIWVPAEQMKSIHLHGVVDDVIQIIYNGGGPTKTQPITVSNTGVDSVVTVTSPNAPVHYRATGVDTTAYIETNATGSTVVLAGVDTSASMVVPANDTLTVIMSAVGSKVMIDGGYESIHMSGVGCEAFVSTDCEAVETTGVGNECSVVTNAVATLADNDLSCVADTTISERKFGDFEFFFEHWGAIIGTIVALLIIIPLVVVLLICGGCITCCVVCGRRKQRRKVYTKEYVGTEQPIVTARPITAVPARAWDPELDGVDPHLVTAKTGTEPKAVGAGDFL